MRKYGKEQVQTVLQMAWPSVLESFFVALIGMVLTTTLYYIGDESPLLGAPSHQRAGAQAIGGKDGFIARIVDFVRHANASPGMLG